MRFLKFLLKAVVVLVVLLVAAVIVLPMVIDPNDYKAQISEQVTAKTGRSFDIAGDIELKTLPWLGVRVNDATLGNAEGFAAPHFAKIGEVDVAVKVLPLLLRRLEADAIRVDGVSVNLERKADGTTNWDSLSQPSTEAPAEPDPDDGRGQPLESIAIDSVNVSNTSVTWSDAQAGQDIAVNNITLTTGQVVPGQPIDLDLSFDASGFAPDTSANVSVDTRVEYSLDQPLYGLAGLAIKAALNGGAVPGGSATINVNAKDARFDGNAQKVTATGLDINTGDIRQDDLTLQAALGGDLVFDIGANKVLLTSLSGGLPVISSPAASGSAALSGAIEADLGAQVFVIDNLALDGSVKGDGTNGESLPISVKADGVADMGAGMASLKTFAVSLPGLTGGGNLDVTGLNDTPSGSGQIAFNDIDIRRLASIAGVKLPAMRDPTALSTASLNATIDGSDAGVKVDPLKLNLDGATIEGTVSIVDFASRAIRFNLVADTLDVDRYSSTEVAEAAPTTAEPAASKPSGAAGGLPIDALRALDVDGAIKVGTLKVANVTMTNLDVALKAKDGVITTDIRNVSLYGGSIRGTELIDVSGEQARIALDTAIEGIAGDKLLADLGITDLDLSGGPSSITLKANGGGDVAAQRFAIEGLALNANLSGKSFPNNKLKASVTGNIAIDAANQAISTRPLKVSFAGANIDTTMDVKDYAGDISYSGTLAVATLNLKTLLPALGQAPIQTSDPKALTRIGLNTSVEGTKNSASLSNLKLNLDDTTASGRLAIADFATQALRFDLDVDKINVDRYTPPASDKPAEKKDSGGGPATVIPVDLIRSLNIDGELRIGELIATGLKLTNVKVKTDAKGGKAVLHPLNANMYGGSYAGNIRVDASGDTPTLSLDEKLQGVQAGPLLQDLQGSAPVTGTANATIKMVGSGATEAQLRRTLDGTAALRFEDGAVKGVDMLGTICRALSGLSLASLNTDNLTESALGLLKDKTAGAKDSGKEGGDNSTRFSAVTATVNLSGGIAENPDLDLRSPLVRVGGNGKVNLIEQTVDYLATTALVSSCEGQGGAQFTELAGIAIPVRITGPFDNLSYKPEFSAATIAAVRKAALESGGGGGVADKAKDALKKLGDKDAIVKSVEDKAKKLLGDGDTGKAVEGLLKEGGAGSAIEGLLGGGDKGAAAAPKAPAKAAVEKATPKPKAEAKKPKAEEKPKSEKEQVKDVLKKGLGGLLGD